MPRMKRASSLRFRRPKPIGRSSVAVSTVAMLSLLSSRLVLGGPADRGDDVLVARAAADRAGDRGADLLLGRVGVLVQQRAAWSSASRACRSRTAARASRGSPAGSGRARRRPRATRRCGSRGPRTSPRAPCTTSRGLPSISTTQAPQLDVSQPQCVPVRPGVSRMKWTSSVRGSTSRVTVLAVDGDRHLHRSGLLVQRAGRRAAQGAFGEHAREVALVVDGAAAVGDRRCSPRTAIAPACVEQLVGRAPGRAAAPRRGSTSIVVGPTALSAMPASAIVSPSSQTRRRRGGDRPVARAPLDLLVRAAARPAAAAGGPR